MIEELFGFWSEEKEDRILEKIFKLYDRDGSGYVDVAEIMAMQ